MITCEIGTKLPSLNEYIRVCRKNKYEAARFKADIESVISIFIRSLPCFEKPVKLHFRWVESTRRRDQDNVAFAKKFILDAMVKSGKLKDDNRRYVTAFTDTFEYGRENKVILTIEEIISK